MYIEAVEQFVLCNFFSEWFTKLNILIGPKHRLLKRLHKFQTCGAVYGKPPSFQENWLASDQNRMRPATSRRILIGRIFFKFIYMNCICRMDVPINIQAESSCTRYIVACLEFFNSIYSFVKFIHNRRFILILLELDINVKSLLLVYIIRWFICWFFGGF